MENFENFKIKGKNITKQEKEYLVSQGYSYCQRCSKVKLISEFGKDKHNAYGFSPKCRECEKQRARERMEEFPDKVRKASREHRRRHSDYYKEQKKLWDSKNRAHINEYKKDKYHNDPLYKMQFVCRQLVRRMFKKIRLDKLLSTSDVLGYTPLELKEHIEKQFKEGMTWDNYGEWHIDHIIPISSAKNLEEGIRLSQLENLQPLWAEENLEKRNKII